MAIGKFARVLGCVLILGIASLVSNSVFAKTATGKPATSERVVLPTTVTPKSYRIDVTPDAEALTFKGSVEIEIMVNEATDRIVLNSADIEISTVFLSGEAQAPAVSYDEANQTATLAFAHKLKPGPRKLTIVYHGKIFEQASGLFVLDYETPQGKARALFTQFENSDARRFVPCWDEPGLKATFELTATVRDGQMAVSNMPIANTDSAAGGLQRVHFATSPKMSSYLLFLGVGDFERVHRTVEGVDVGVIVKRGDTANAAYALDTAAQILSYYNSYFGVRYPLPKLDLIAGPGSSGVFSAMENWGAIFYFEHAVLIDPRVSTESDKQNVYVTIAHEMAHQWFGDLVTMAWWDDLWLNEGFASWMESKATDHFHPEWNIWLQALGEKQGAMSVDASDGTHPIITPINDVLQASGAFDAITYQKGAAVIQTLEAYVGEDAFRAGVRRYMHDHAYGNTLTDDLWKEIDKGSKRPITRIAHDLTLQAGVPLVSEVSTRCEAGNTKLELAQGHFAIDPDSTAARLWQVPVTAAVLGGAPAKTVVGGPNARPLEVAGCGPVILNVGQTAYFRSRYSAEVLAAISKHYAALSAYDQLGVFNDTGSLAYVGEEPMSALLDLTKNFPLDADPVLVSTLVGWLHGLDPRGDHYRYWQLHGLDRIYDGLPTQAGFRTYASGVLKPLFMRIGWDKKAGEADNVSESRTEIITALADFGDPDVLAEAKRRYGRFVADPASLDAESRHNVLGVIATHADAAIWDQLHGMARSARTQLERQEFYELLASAKDKGLARQALDLALSGEPPATIPPRMINVAAELNPELAIEFVIANWAKIAPLLESGSQATYVPRLFRSVTDLALIARLDAFAEAHIPASARQDVRKAEALVRYLAKVRTERLPEADRWIKSQNG